MGIDIIQELNDVVGDTPARPPASYKFVQCIVLNIVGRIYRYDQHLGFHLPLGYGVYHGGSKGE